MKKLDLVNSLVSSLAMKKDSDTLKWHSKSLNYSAHPKKLSAPLECKFHKSIDSVYVIH